MSEESVEVTFQRMLDSGTSSMMVGRIKSLLKAFNWNVGQFIVATKSQLEATYAKTHPAINGREKGLGESTYIAFDEFVKLRKAASYDVRKVAEETVKIQEERKAMVESAKDDAMATVIDIQAMSDAVAWYSTAFSECTLGDLMKAYSKFKEKKEVSK